MQSSLGSFATSFGWTGGDPCLGAWPGVACGPSGAVVSLALPSLSGALPPSLFAITSLTSLAVASGSVASLPSEVGQLTALVSLSLPGLGVSGTLPSALGLCTALRSVDLARNSGLSGSLPASLFTLPALTSLSLAGASLTG